MKKIILSLSIFASASIAMAQNWTLDKAHAKLGFTVTHMLLSDVDGNFKTFDVAMKSSKPDFTDASIIMNAEVASVNTDNEKRDEHLKGPDFFDATKLPTINFTSSSFKKVAGKNYKMTGNLTMHGITKPVVFDVVFNGVGTHPYTKKTVAGFKLKGKIKRTDFKLGDSVPNAMVSNEVVLLANVEFSKD